MRNFLFTITWITFLFAANHTHAQQEIPKKELIEMMALNTSYTFLDLYQSDSRIIPRGYRRVHQSSPTVLDNVYQIYRTADGAVINFRGSTSNPNSWIENLYSAMIPASDTLTLKDKRIIYSFAKQPKAAVHTGYAIAILLIGEELIEQVNQLNQSGIYRIVFTGHSQGGALADMARAYFENLPAGQIHPSTQFYTYSFASPMCGNHYFAVEYNYRFASNGTSYRIINPQDIVPSFPLNFENANPFSKENILAWITGAKEFDMKKLGLDLLVGQFEGGIQSYVKKSNEMIHKVLTMQFGDVKLPNYVEDINYAEVGKVVKIGPFPYPEIIRDSVDIPARDLAKYKPIGNQKYQRKEPRFYQHKPYNYYVDLLRRYDESEYRKLKVKVLEENL
jgi:triacylglycerol lipase